MYAACQGLVSGSLSYAASFMADVSPLYSLLIGLSLAGAIGAMVIGWMR